MPSHCSIQTREIRSWIGWILAKKCQGTFRDKEFHSLTVYISHWIEDQIVPVEKSEAAALFLIQAGSDGNAIGDADFRIHAEIRQLLIID